MKKLILSLVAIATISLSSFGQAPEGFKYQAVVRDAGNTILNNQAVGMQIEILQGGISGTPVYTESFTPTTNTYGLVNLEIGTGTTSDDFTIIDWANDTYFIRTSIDVTGGSSYAVMGTSQLMSVPYALYAKTSGSSIPGPQGPAGNDGANGAQGPAGNDGAQGLQGIQGPAGADGAIGAQGATGPQGPAGNDGAQGATGPQGPAGNDGAVGATGPQGPAGNDGAIGATGPTGPQGPVGATGAQGPAGLDGNGIASTVDNGDGTFTFTYDDGTTFTTSDLTGPQGVTGPQGPIGNDGAIGATGPQGPIGNDGPTGATGPQGPAGNDGAVGATGPQGPQGLTGNAGPQGATGPQGLTGPQGPAGNDGAQGLQGIQGPIGATGATGAQGQGGVTTAGTGINVTGAGTGLDPYVVNAGTCGLSIGDTYQGGIIFYLDATGCHGLIAAPSDQSTGIVWWNGSYTNTYASGSGLFDGDGNCYRIRGSQGDCASCNAAELCLDLILGGYLDWYLPSKYELNLMYRNIGQGNALGLGNVGGFASYFYWSSTEYGNASAWRQNFGSGSQGANDKANYHYVRAVRAF